MGDPADALRYDLTAGHAAQRRYRTCRTAGDRKLTQLIMRYAGRSRGGEAGSTQLYGPVATLASARILGDAGGVSITSSTGSYGEHEVGAPFEHEAQDTSEESEAEWADREKVWRARDVAIRQIAPTLVGKSVAEARQLVEQASTAEVPLSLRVAIPSQGTFDIRVRGEIVAWVTDGRMASTS